LLGQPISDDLVKFSLRERLALLLLASAAIVRICVRGVGGFAHWFHPFPCRRTSDPRNRRVRPPITREKQCEDAACTCPHTGKPRRGSTPAVSQCATARKPCTA